MYLCILLLPFLSFLSTNVLGRYIGINGSLILAPTSIFLAFCLSLIAFYEVTLCHSPCTLYLFKWFESDLFFVSWGFYFDSLATFMLLVVNGVSCLVHLYSTEYMAGDPHQGRFMGYLSLFTGCMLLLVCADNFLVMFFGWEGIGLASFLLIGFWYTRVQAGKSAIKAMLVNRVGDLGLALGIGATFLTFKSVDYLVVFSLVPLVVDTVFTFFSFDFDRLTVIALLLFWGALGKSAQIGLHIWLPDAMEGPTPVSALIHAATLVTAGVFLIIRCSIVFENSSAPIVLTVVGSLTAFFASSVGLVQNDIKRVIAYSTCSQLGYMVFSAGLSHYSIAFFHLANHALFKALLFLSAGCIIHGIADDQDMRRMGGLIRFFPISYTMILIGSLALVGFPFLTGFYSKDVILEVAASKNTNAGCFAHFLGCVAAFCTSFYSFRLVFLTFFNRIGMFKSHMSNVHDGPVRMLIPLLVLALGAIFWGFLSRDLVIGLGSPTFNNSIYNANNSFNAIDSEFLHPFIKNIPFICTCLGASLSLFLIHCFKLSKRDVFLMKLTNTYRMVYTFLTQKWHFDQISNDFIVIRTMSWGYRTSFLMIDKGFIETFGPSGIVFNVFGQSKNLTNSQTGHLFNYALVMMVFLVAILVALAIPLVFKGSMTITYSVLVFFSYVTFIIGFGLD